jgi:RNA polymerase primary sigma factor
MGHFASAETTLQVRTEMPGKPKSVRLPGEGSSLSAYLREIGGNRVLTRQEERNLFDRITRGDKRAMHELIRANLKFVVSVCRKYQNQGLPMTDLISEGNLGLIRAAEGFDGSRQCRFISYAVWWIRQRILRALAEQTRFITIPVGKATTLRKVAQAEKVIAQRIGRTPTSEELADYLSLREKEVLDLLQIGQYSQSMHEPRPYQEEDAAGDGLADRISENPEEGCETSNLVQEVRGALDGLRGSEREVLRLNYGLGSSKPLNLEEIADILGLTRAQVRRIRDDALENLRQPIRKTRFRELL